MILRSGARSVSAAPLPFVAAKAKGRLSTKASSLREKALPDLNT